MKKNKPRKRVRKYISIADIRCPICKGHINEKWFHFRRGNVVEFIAECWQPYKNNDEKPYPRHIFFFQIETPDCVLVYDKRSDIFRGGNDSNK